MIVAVWLPLYTGLTALHFAADSHGRSYFVRLSCVALLLSAGARMRPDLVGDTPLHYVLHRTRDDDRALASLKSLMVSPNAYLNLDKQNLRGQTPLSIAATGGHIQSVKFLLACKANVNHPLESCGGITALHQALHYEQIEVAKILIAAGACLHPVLATSFGVLTPLTEWCCDKEEIETIVDTYAGDVRPRRDEEVPCCSHCGLDTTSEGRAKHHETKEIVSKRCAEFAASRCSNPGCEALWEHKSHLAIRLRKCGRCRQTAYCG